MPRRPSAARSRAVKPRRPRRPVRSRRPAQAEAGPRRGAAPAALEETPGRGVHRMLSPLERESLSTEAWGYLLSLRRRGSLDAGQFERVLDRLTATGVRPIDVALVREVAARVALRP